MTVLNGLMAFCSSRNSSFSRMQQISKPFKLPTFWPLNLMSGPRGRLKQKGIFSAEMNHHPVVCCAYKVERH
jgi:hypothetical protein